MQPMFIQQVSTCYVQETTKGQGHSKIKYLKELALQVCCHMSASLFPPQLELIELIGGITSRLWHCSGDHSFMHVDCLINLCGIIRIIKQESYFSWAFSLSEETFQALGRFHNETNSSERTFLEMKCPVSQLSSPFPQPLTFFEGHNLNWNWDPMTTIFSSLSFPKLTFTSSMILHSHI